MSFEDLIFYPTKVLTPLVLPPTGFVLLAIIALLLLNRWPRTARTTLWLSVLSLFAFSLPIVARGMVALLDAPPFDPKSGKQVQAIMILGGGLLRATPEYGDTLNSHSLARTRYGAKLAKQFILPILVTGGSVYGGTPEGDLMAKVLTEEYGVTAKWIENRSRHTGENARFSAEILQKDHVRKVLLVTDELHMRRALAHCAAAGLICYPAPVSGGFDVSDSWIEQLPNSGALNTSSFALHELLGNIALRWR